MVSSGEVETICQKMARDSCRSGDLLAFLQQERHAYVGESASGEGDRARGEGRETGIEQRAGPPRINRSLPASEAG